MERQRFDNFDLSYYPQIQEPGRPCAARENMERVKSYCMEFARHFESAERSLLMIGGSGLGKTHLSSAIAGELLEQGYSVIYETAGDIFAAFEAEKFSRPNPRPVYHPGIPGMRSSDFGRLGGRIQHPFLCRRPVSAD